MATVPVTLSLPCCPGLTWKSLSLPSDLSLGSAGMGKEWARDLGVTPVVGLPFGHVGAFCPSPSTHPSISATPPPGPLLLCSQNHIWLPSELQLLKRTKKKTERGLRPGRGSTGWLILLSILPLAFVHVLNTWSPPGGKAVPDCYYKALTHSPHARFPSGTGGWRGCVQICSFKPQNNPMK